MRSRLLAVFACSLQFAALAGAQTTLTTIIDDSSSRFNRPEFTGYLDNFYNPGLHPASEWTQVDNTLHPYSARTFTVATTGAYTITATGATVSQDNPDPYTVLYDDAFNPATPLLNGITLNDDIAAADPRYSSLPNITLTAGNKYTLVTTYFLVIQTGTVDYAITGPGAIDLAPVVLSSDRLTPSGIFTNAGSVVFRVTFSEAVASVSTAAFQLTTTGTATGTIASLASVNGVVFDVTVTGVSGNGTLRLDLKNSGTAIVDSSGQSPGEFVTGQTYIVLQPPVISSSLAASGTYNSAFSYTIAAFNTPTSYSATGLPAGLSIDTGTGAITGTLRATGTIPITIGATNQTGSDSKTLTLTVPKVAVTVSGITAADKTYDGATTATINTASAALNGVLSGDTVTLVTSGATGAFNTATVGTGKTVTISGLSLTGTDAANYTLIAPTATAAITQRAQTITFNALPDRLTTDAASTLTGSVDSTLAVAYSVVSGPARITGTTLTLTGAIGTVTVRAAQPGDTNHLAATPVDRTFTVTAPVRRIFLGSVRNASSAPSGDIALILPANTNTGTLLIGSGAAGVHELVTFTLQTDGTIALNLALDTTGTIALQATQAGNAFTGTLGSAGFTVTAALDPATGSTAALAGLHTIAALGADTGSTYLVVGANGSFIAVSDTPGAELSASGTLAGDNTFTANGDVSPRTISGSIVGPIINATVSLPGRTVAYRGLLPGTTRTDRLINLSSRGLVQTGSRIIVAGFVVTGTGSKPVLIRAVGPQLLAFGVTDAVTDPVLTLFKGSVVVAQNDDWESGGGGPAIASAAALVGAFNYESATKDAAILATLEPGAYTAQITSNSGAGVALVEVYDASATAGTDTQRLVNVSGRGVTAPGSGVLTAGFVITGNAPKRVLVRGIGPALLAFEVTDAVVDTALSVFAGSTLIATNDDWSIDAINAAAVAAANTASGAFGLVTGAKDAAAVLTLAPGVYTLQVSGKGTTGVALAEVYELE